MHDESLYAERALRAGARGYITKNEASAKVMTALRQVLAGEIYVGTKAATKILGNLSHASQGGSGVERLTDRELEVFEKIGRGRTTREISIQLGVGRRDRGDPSLAHQGKIAAGKWSAVATRSAPLGAGDRNGRGIRTQGLSEFRVVTFTT